MVSTAGLCKSFTGTINPGEREVITCDSPIMGHTVGIFTQRVLEDDPAVAMAGPLSLCEVEVYGTGAPGGSNISTYMSVGLLPARV